MEDDLRQKIELQEKKLDEIYRSVEKMRNYFKWTLIVTLVTIVLPLIGLVFVIPMFLKTLNLSNLGL